ncbi:MAG: FAD-dependent oxidoreductase [Candidatus Blackburnbacteria bacterium]|nr:FAD-dependent oxidoreductase [Candidatus Blackburnbacteria bacterium]
MDFKLRLQDKRDEAKGTKTFIFEKPQGFTYKAGQYMYFTLPELKYQDKRGNVRHFTLSSSPTENFLSITIRMREESGYKKTLDSLELGSEMSARGPQGVFVLEDKSAQEQQIMLAGGIGITPFRSIAKYATDKGLPIPIHIIYSNSIPEEIAFRKELDELTAKNPALNVIHTITKPEESKEAWTGHTRRIDENLIRKLEIGNCLPAEASAQAGKLATGKFWLCGPPLMVSALEEVLEKMQIPQERIRIEKFTGY